MCVMESHARASLSFRFQLRDPTGSCMYNTLKDVDGDQEGSMIQIVIPHTLIIVIAIVTINVAGVVIVLVMPLLIVAIAVAADRPSLTFSFFLVFTVAQTVRNGQTTTNQSGSHL